MSNVIELAFWECGHIEVDTGATHPCDRDVCSATYRRYAPEDAKHKVQRDVEDFHREVCGIEDATTPAIRRPELRANLIAEEARELLEAILGRQITITVEADEATADGPDLLAAIDGMCDLLCVVYGTAAEFGLTLAPFWDEVHRTNMAKVGGPVRVDGKRLKPEGWTAPDIASVLEAMQR